MISTSDGGGPRPARPAPPAPSTFVAGWLPRIRATLGPRRDVLDVAAGAGRHARAAAEAGFRVYGVDSDLDRLRRARAGGPTARLWAADLAVSPLPRDRFDLIICTNYLQRSLWPGLRAAVRSGGFVIYETFTVAQLAHGTGPRSPDHLLRPGELRRVFADWLIRHDEEHRDPTAVAQVVAMKP